jgi:hypothetical protein
MPLRLNVGLSRKVGMPRFGSVGASCALEVELDQMLLFHNGDQLQEKVQAAFDACRQAVTDELVRQAASDENGDERSSSQGNGQGGAHNGQQPAERPEWYLPATPRQLRAIEGIATRQRISLHTFLRDRGDKQFLNELTRVEASRLIEELQALDRAPSTG